MQPSNIIANSAARYRSVVRLYAEALGAGALDLGQVPEIDAAFKELGRMAGLDFEEVRRELGTPEKKKRGRPPEMTCCSWPTCRIRLAGETLRRFGESIAEKPLTG